ncbi:hypothetical protein BDZ94DRAFT_1301806 [Collybia nuda]|uniref:Uncharacterized protein n=1 Tax=Collybia nuda TaxID=64659 RepID=A0A9P6C9V3_9AGAR|nr:hypothetical protein BDZ94DRAFT_1301806 [Collybia nuda]
MVGTNVGGVKWPTADMHACPPRGKGCPIFDSTKRDSWHYVLNVYYMGIYLSSFLYCINGLLWSKGRLKNRRALNYPMIFAATWLFTVSSLDVALGFQLNLSAFSRLEGNATEYFSKISNWANVMKLSMYVAQTFMADCILLYRCWIVYGRNWKVVIVPTIMWIAETVSGAIAVSKETRLENTTIISHSLAPYLISMITLTLATNVVATSLMIFRIWSIQTEVNLLLMEGGNSSPTMAKSLLVLIESGSLYTLVTLVFLCTYATSNFASYVTSDCLVQIMGIVFNLILIRVARGTAVRSLKETISILVKFRHDTVDLSSTEDKRNNINIGPIVGESLEKSKVRGGSKM